MTQSFHLTILEREVRRIKQKHLDTVNDLLSQYFKKQSPPKAVHIWFEFNARSPELFAYLIGLYTLGCFLSKEEHIARLEKYYAKSSTPSTVRRTIGLLKNLAVLNIDILTSYCQVHHKDVNQHFVKIKEKMACPLKSNTRKRKIVPTAVGVCYALSLSGTHYCLGHILVSEAKSIPEKDIKVAVMTKESIAHTPKITAVVRCTLKYVPRHHRYYRPFILLDTRDQGLYDFTILINRVTRSLEEVKRVLVEDKNIHYVITPAP